MGKFLAGIIIGGVILFVYQHATRAVPAHEPLPVAAETPEPEVLTAVEREETQFRCDGRNYCSQMTSCEEATWFIEHCSGAEMDGDGDGVPCEKQWCRRL